MTSKKNERRTWGGFNDLVKYGIWPDYGGQPFNPFNPGEPLEYLEDVTGESFGLSDSVSVTVHPKPPGPGTRIEDVPEESEESRRKPVGDWPADEPEDTDRPRRPVAVYPTDIEQTTADLLALRDSVSLQYQGYPTESPTEDVRKDKFAPSPTCSEIEAELQQSGLSLDICGRHQTGLNIVGTRKTKSSHRKRG